VTQDYKRSRNFVTLVKNSTLAGRILISIMHCSKDRAAGAACPKERF
jgi:hypothetical protein